jgi:hypothetical protein
MGRGKSRSFFTRFSETHHRPAQRLMGFADKSAFKTRFFLLYPSYTPRYNGAAFAHPIQGSHQVIVRIQNRL